MPAKARLPDNLMNPKIRAEREEILSLHSSGVLYALHKFLAERLCLYEAEVDHEHKLYIGGEPVTDNALWRLLRRDVEAQEFPIPSHILKRIVEISFSYIRAHAPQDLAQGERAVIVSLKE